MKVLIIGSGGREHALAWKAAQSPEVQQVFVAPGNGGTALEDNITNVPIDVLDLQGLLHFVKTENIDLTIVGPEAPLAAGIVDRFNEHSLPCFGPSQMAAQLEASKSFSKAFMERYGIPTARYNSFTDHDKAIAYIESQSAPIVVKADGLAAGKGVIIAQTKAEAITAVEDILKDNRFGDAGSSVVIEEFLQGEELSYMVVSDGQHVLPLASSQDHKARDDGDKGPNTGGMGAYSPSPLLTPDLEQRIIADVIQPTIEGMAAEGNPYTGFLYAGLMVSPDGSINVLEFNCRLGDPETQPIMMRLQSDLVTLCLDCLTGNLHHYQAKWDPRVALGVVLCAGGYPGAYRKNDPIQGLKNSAQDSEKVFHAGTVLRDNSVLTAGGRVLCVTCLADSVEEAQQAAYRAIAPIEWPDMFYRRDIGDKASKKLIK